MNPHATSDPRSGTLPVQPGKWDRTVTWCQQIVLTGPWASQRLARTGHETPLPETGISYQKRPHAVREALSGGKALSILFAETKQSLDPAPQFQLFSRSLNTPRRNSLAAHGFAGLCYLIRAEARFCETVPGLSKHPRRQSYGVGQNRFGGHSVAVEK